jgi:D-alanine-D-alanine ligase
MHLFKICKDSAMKEKLRVGLICGGTSCEHEVSLVTARNVLLAMDPAKYDIVPIFIDKNGSWHHFEAIFLVNIDSKALLTDQTSQTLLATTKSQSVCLPETRLDVVFPLVHGPYGEDGTIQGFLKLARIPFVGAEVLGSAIGMDKDVMKRLLREAGLPVGGFMSIQQGKRHLIDVEEIIQTFGFPLFVKPANLGSSVGISKAKNKEELKKAIDLAFQFDRKILIEECIVGREIECAVLGNDMPIASVVGEVRTTHEFYTYEAKYIEDVSTIEIPANIPFDVSERAKMLSIKAFEVLCCEGMARIDFFLKEDGTLLINEINTIPGFTNRSMYPKLWEASGIAYAELIDRLLHLAIERHTAISTLKISKS